MKLQKQQIRKIDISLINKTKNIRKQYDDIELLARSIERDGQLQPIGVVEQEDGTFNLLYGFRRYHAHLFLINEGKDFNQIEAKITTGDPAVIQLIENIHRKNLRPEEFEDALQILRNSGLKVKEIAERLNIRITRVSDALAAKRTRDDLKEKNIDTSEMSTSTVSLLRSVPEEKQKEVIKKVKKKGGTVKAVKEIIGIQKEQIKNPDYCTKPELCKKLPNKISCKICSYNIKNQQIEQKEKPFIQMSIKDFLRLSVVKEIVDHEKIILQDKCEYCGKEF